MTRLFLSLQPNRSLSPSLSDGHWLQKYARLRCMQGVNKTLGCQEVSYPKGLLLVLLPRKRQDCTASSSSAVTVGNGSMKKFRVTTSVTAPQAGHRSVQKGVMTLWCTTCGHTLPSLKRILLHRTALEDCTRQSPPG